MEILLSKSSVLGDIKVPLDLTIKVGKEYFLKEECLQHYQKQKLVPLGKTYKNINGLAYPIKECFQVRTSRSSQSEMHASMCPDLVQTNDGNNIINPTVARELGYRNIDGVWMIVHDNDPYHSGRRNDFSKHDSIYRIGFEIEKEDRTAKESYPAVMVRKLGWSKERDGSLDEGTGYELVSPVYDLFEDKLKEDVESNQMLRDLINAKFTARCGGHINISCTNCSVRDLYRTFAPYYPLFYSMYPRRASVSTCLARKSDQMLLSGKYSAVHCKEYALELRIFPAVESVKDLLWRLKLIRYMVRNAVGDFTTIPNLLLNNNELSEIVTEGGFSPTQLAVEYNNNAKKYA